MTNLVSNSTFLRERARRALKQNGEKEGPGLVSVGTRSYKMILEGIDERGEGEGKGGR